MPEFDSSSEATQDPVLNPAARSSAGGAELGPTITATLDDGPLEGSSIEAEVVEGRPPKTIDVPADDGSTCRYCLEGWVQEGRFAAYTFLYRV